MCFVNNYLEEGEEVPCDLVVLASSDSAGCCYIQVYLHDMYKSDNEY